MKKLHRSRTDRKLSGVLGGLSDYLGIDASILRILFVILLIPTGFFPLGIIYIAWIFLVPEESDIM
jgi:phage shock protein C